MKERELLLDRVREKRKVQTRNRHTAANTPHAFKAKICKLIVGFSAPSNPCLGASTRDGIDRDLLAAKRCSRNYGRIRVRKVTFGELISVCPLRDARTAMRDPGKPPTHLKLGSHPDRKAPLPSLQILLSTPTKHEQTSNNRRQCCCCGGATNSDFNPVMLIDDPLLRSS